MSHGIMSINHGAMREKREDSKRERERESYEKEKVNIHVVLLA